VRIVLRMVVSLFLAPFRESHERLASGVCPI
jgi:hypothetical protein